VSSGYLLSFGSPTFSILERIDVGETRGCTCSQLPGWTFSILERIDVGETRFRLALLKYSTFPFSILERIDVGETVTLTYGSEFPDALSVSSNGSTWVKLSPPVIV